MDAADVISVVAVVVTAISVALAFVQYHDGKRNEASERELIERISERLRTAVSGAEAAREGADLIVQRSKEPGATMPELANVARMLRGNLAVLERLLDEQVRSENPRTGRRRSRRSLRRRPFTSEVARSR